MSTRVQWLGHACLLIESDGKRVLIDPFLSGNPMAAAKPDEVEADVILVSHGHEDHLGDTLAIARRTGATVVANYELGTWLKGQGLTKVHGMQHGGGCQVDPAIHVKLTVAFHGSTLPGGGYGGNPCGFLVSFADGSRIYDAADTALFGDMKLIGEEGIDLAILPIGGHYTMDPGDAVRAAKLVGAKFVIPGHYNTFPAIQQDPQAFKADLEARTGSKGVVLAPGESFELN
jgi:L-ascorbate metabolism protein UlaG (beta-lactamase superfamily)